MKLTARHTVLATLLIGLPLIQAAGNCNRASACAVTGPGCPANPQAGSCCGAAPCGLGDNAITDSNLPAFDAETLALLHDQIAEERMAARVYRTFAETFPHVRPFQMIPRAEDRHGGSIATLLAGSDPAFSVSAMIINPSYSSLGDELIARGSASEVDALRVGAYIEERDILDLRALATRLNHDGAKAIVAQLEQGSHHHLNAFVRNLRSHGVDYTPQLLTAEAFTAIVSDES